MKFIPSGQPLPANTAAWPNTEDVLARVAALADLPAIALHFPKWTDGRAYSQAVLLRQRLRWSGQLVATGEVLVDMLPLLQRCGFSAVQLRADQDLGHAARALRWFQDTPAPRTASVPDAPPPAALLHYQRAPGDRAAIAGAQR